MALIAMTNLRPDGPGGNRRVGSLYLSNPSIRQLAVDWLYRLLSVWNVVPISTYAIMANCGLCAWLIVVTEPCLWIQFGYLAIPLSVLPPARSLTPYCHFSQPEEGPADLSVTLLLGLPVPLRPPTRY